MILIYFFFYGYLLFLFLKIFFSRIQKLLWLNKIHRKKINNEKDQRISSKIFMKILNLWSRSKYNWKYFFNFSKYYGNNISINRICNESIIWMSKKIYYLFVLLVHSLYSLNLASSNFYLFLILKIVLNKKSFNNKDIYLSKCFSYKTFYSKKYI